VIFRERWLALLAAAVLPGTGRDAELRLHKEAGPDGFALETGNGGELAGYSALFDERLVEALHVVACLVRSPEALANVLAAAGPLALLRAGAVLDERVPVSLRETADAPALRRCPDLRTSAGPGAGGSSPRIAPAGHGPTPSGDLLRARSPREGRP
jgi:hypothetical protein